MARRFLGNSPLEMMEINREPSGANLRLARAQLELSSCRCPAVSGAPHSPGPAGRLGETTSKDSGVWEDDSPAVLVQVKWIGKKRSGRWGRQLRSVLALQTLFGLRGAREESAVFNREAGKRGGREADPLLCGAKLRGCPGRERGCTVSAPPRHPPPRAAWVAPGLGFPPPTHCQARTPSPSAARSP